jgi:hypothetical protein
MSREILTEVPMFQVGETVHLRKVAARMAIVPYKVQARRFEGDGFRYDLSSEWAPTITGVFQRYMRKPA